MTTVTGGRPDGRTAKPTAEPTAAVRPSVRPAVLESKAYSFWYGPTQALHEVNCAIAPNAITALIGPSGCGKTTFLRSINRLHDLTPGARHEGDILLDGTSIFAPGTDVVGLRRRVGMVFQRPNPFPKAVYDNVADGPREPGTSLSGGQQQRLCIARALANEPEMLLMDEPCSALDPIATQRIEELLVELKKTYTIVIVTHNMQQAARVSDYTGFFYVGRLVEFGVTQQIFTRPADERTEAYITGRFG